MRISGRGEIKTEHDACIQQFKLHSDAQDQLEKLLNAAMAKETSERLKGLVKAEDECGKLRAELECHNKAHGATINEIREKINTVKTEAKAALDTVEKDFSEKLSSCAGSLESAKTELAKNVDAKVDALEGKTMAAREALGKAIRYNCSRVLYCAFVWCTY